MKNEYKTINGAYKDLENDILGNIDQALKVVSTEFIRLSIPRISQSQPGNATRGNLRRSVLNSSIPNKGIVKASTPYAQKNMLGNVKKYTEQTAVRDPFGVTAEQDLPKLVESIEDFYNKKI